MEKGTQRKKETQMWSIAGAIFLTTILFVLTIGEE